MYTNAKARGQRMKPDNCDATNQIYSPLLPLVTFPSPN